MSACRLSLSQACPSCFYQLRGIFYAHIFVLAFIISVHGSKCLKIFVSVTSGILVECMFFYFAEYSNLVCDYSVGDDMLPHNLLPSLYMFIVCKRFVCIRHFTFVKLQYDCYL